MSHYQQAIVLIDQGGHSTRALLYADNGQLLAESRMAVNVHHLNSFQVEMALAPLLRSVDYVLKDIAKKAKQLGVQTITKAGLIVQRSSFLVVDKHSLQPIGNVVSWMDARNHAWLQQQSHYFDEIQAISGLYPNAHYAFSKIQWLLKNTPTLAEKHHHGQLLFTPLAAYLAHYLCQSDTIVVDPVIASRTMLMDIANMQWSKALLAIIGITEEDLPRIVDSDYTVGSIETEHYVIPLDLVGGDQSFVVFSAGTDKAQDLAFINVGSGAFVQQLCSHLPKQTRLLKSPLFINKKQRYIALEGTINAAASALSNLYGDAKPDFAAIEKAMQANHAIPHYRNTLAGSGSPYWIAAAKPQFSFAATQEIQAVAILESVIFALSDNLAVIQQSCSSQAILISGGLSQSASFCQKLANCTQLAVMRAKDVEASSRGAAFFMLNIQAAQAQLTFDRFTPKEDKRLLKRYALHQDTISLIGQT